MHSMSRFALLLAVLCSDPLCAAPVVVANPSVSAKPSEDDIKSVFLGQSNSLGGSSVQVGMPKEGKLREDFLSSHIGKNDKQFRAVWSQLIFTGKAQAIKQFDSEDEVKKWVAATPNAVGIVDSAGVDGSVKLLGK
jgi:hypothetical protein